MLLSKVLAVRPPSRVVPCPNSLEAFGFFVLQITNLAEKILTVYQEEITGTIRQTLPPLQRHYLQMVYRRRWQRWAFGFGCTFGLPLAFSAVFNLGVFTEMSFGDAINHILTVACYFYFGFFPILIILSGYLIFLLFKKLIPLYKDIRGGQKVLQVIPADKYKMEQFNQYFVRTQFKQYPFIAMNGWVYEQIPDGSALVIELSPRSGIYLGLRSMTGEVLLTEKPESIY